MLCNSANLSQQADSAPGMRPTVVLNKVSHQLLDVNPKLLIRFWQVISLKLTHSELIYKPVQ